MPRIMPTNATVATSITTEVFLISTKMSVITAEVPVTSMISLMSADMTLVATTM